jgi:hypothetical protein
MEIQQQRELFINEISARIAADVTLSTECLYDLVSDLWSVLELKKALKKRTCQSSFWQAPGTNNSINFKFSDN